MKARQGAIFSKGEKLRTILVKLTPKEFDAFVLAAHQQTRTPTQQARHRWLSGWLCNNCRRIQ